VEDYTGKHTATRRLVPNEYSSPRPEVEPDVSGWISYASWLSDDILLMVGWFHTEEEAPPRVYFFSDNQPIALEARCITYSRLDLPEPHSRAGKVLTVRFPDSGSIPDPLGSLIVETESATNTPGPLDIWQALTNLQNLLQGGIIWWNSGERAKVLKFLVSVSAEHGTTVNSLQVSKSLFTIREALRDRLPRAAADTELLQALHVDNVLAINRNSFYINGWALDREVKLSRLTAVTPEGSRVELLKSAFRYVRRDVAEFYAFTTEEVPELETGFICYAQTEQPSLLSNGWIVEMQNAAGIGIEAVCPPVQRGIKTVRDAILKTLPLANLPNETLMANHVSPAISSVQEQFRRVTGVERVIQYGTPPDSPEVSVVIPLYKRIDLLEQQLAHFVHDLEIARSDLIYVLDSPELSKDLREHAAQLAQLYRIPFRVVELKHNAGYSAANNVGVSYARGPLLLLLNSDIFPESTGWLREMTSFYTSTPNIGALGPKLLYEDESLQHAGMYFHLPRNTALADLWQNMHYYKGLHRSLPAANVTRSVPAVTGACLMIARDLYQRAGGFQDTYLQGDHEDSDLCLRLVQLGYENWYLADVELYHLEAQSYPGPLRGLTALYNRWLHTRLWGEHIEALMGRFPSPTTYMIEGSKK